jgi:hypothetical protein
MNAQPCGVATEEAVALGSLGLSLVMPLLLLKCRAEA